MEHAPGTVIAHDGRPAVIATRPAIGADGITAYGIRYTDVPQFIDDPRMPGLRRPTTGANKIARVGDFVVA